jgi:hypothetical protein
MTQTLIGFDYEGVPAIKITKGDIDVASEPDENVGSFLYNSKWTKDYKIAGIDLMAYVGASTFWPSGSGLSNYTKYTEPYALSSGGQASYFRSAHFPSLLYDLPLVDIKARKRSNGRFVGASMRESLHHYDRRGGNWYTPTRGLTGWATGATVYYNSTSGYLGSGTVIRNYLNTGGEDDPELFNHLVVWNLPGDETEILDGTPQPPVEGAHVIEIDSGGVRVAKPGFDLRNITRSSQIAFDTANSPTKIIGAGDTICAGGGGVSSYDLGVEIPADAVADVHTYLGSTIIYPTSPTGDTFGVEYWFDGSTIHFYNPYALTCRVRFIVYSNSPATPTSGDNEVLRQFNDGTQDVVQMLRPGSADPPNFEDIVLDSRWPCVQILADGYIPVGVGSLTHTVDFDGAGCFPMVKYVTVHGSGSADDFFASWGKRTRVPCMNVCGNRQNPNYGVGWIQTIGGDATYCTLTNSQAVFSTFRGNPTSRYYKDASDYNSNKVTFEYDPNPIVGLRYYILGIPAA